MTDKTVLLEDEFEFKTVPFLVKVERKDMYVNAETGDVRGINFYGSPTGMDKSPKQWVVCDCVIARLRPDYSYRVDKEWPENVDKHFSVIEPLEVPKKSKGIIFTSYESVKEKDMEDIDLQEMAKKVVVKMKQAYNNRTEVESLNM